MSLLLSELPGMGLVGVLFLSLFAIGEFLRRRTNLSGECTRKFVHFGGCMVALAFPLLFKSVWSVFILCIIFTSIIYMSAKLGLLTSVHGVERKTYGGIYHPIAIFLSFLICSLLGEMLFFQIGIMVLALSDSMAAILGRIYGRKGYTVEKDSRKSVEGSVIFFLLTFLIVHLTLLLATDMGRPETVLVAVLVATLVTLFEAVSLDGADNLFIPLGTILILSKNAVPDIYQIAFQLLALALTAAILFLIMRPFRKIGVSGYIVLTLSAYAAWGLVDIFWMLPFLYAIILISRTNQIIEAPENPEDIYRVQPTFYLVIAPVIWILSANFAGKIYGEDIHSCFFASLLIALTAQLVIQRTRRLKSSTIMGMCRDSALLFIPPALLFPLAVPGSWRIWLLQAGAAFVIILCIAIIWHTQKSESKPLSRKLLLLRMMLTFCGSALPAAADLLYFFLQRNNI